MDIAEFDYELPPELIAQHPLAERDASRLMVIRRAGGDVEHRAFRELPELLSPGDLLVANRSRVMPARLLGRRPGGGTAELLLIARVGPDEWEALARPGRRLRPGDVVAVSPELRVRIEGAAQEPDGRRKVRLLGAGADSEPLIARWGHVPLPPYIRRPDGPDDRVRYQTIYAREPGSVAAPTAGLHFTESLIARLRARGVEWAEVLLHVGPGTFRPVKAARAEDHRVDPEPFEIPEDTARAIHAARGRGGRVIAVGTTTARALESAADAAGDVAPARSRTGLVIVPGFRFRALDALLTNFHLPRSSLLLLVAAFAGRERVLAAYADAVRSRYRFYSYGDAMLLL